MNRPVVIAAGLTFFMGVALVLMLRDDEPVPVAEAPAPPSAPRIVPKKTEGAPPPVTPKKAAPKKTEPKPVEPAAPAAPTLASLTLESDVPGASVFIDRAFVGNT